MPDSIALIAALVITFIIGRKLWPFGPCRFCGGRGKTRGSNSSRWGWCGRCDGSGERPRFGTQRRDR